LQLPSCSNGQFGISNRVAFSQNLRRK
jgi:hypothetical protein